MAQRDVHRVITPEGHVARQHDALRAPRRVRGSSPAPGPDYFRYGGNTSCVEISLDDGTVLVITRFIKGMAAAFTAPAGWTGRAEVVERV